MRLFMDYTEEEDPHVEDSQEMTALVMKISSLGQDPKIEDVRRIMTNGERVLKRIGIEDDRKMVVAYA